MALTYNKATRDLAIKGTITFNDGTQEKIFGEDILNYSYSAQIGSEGLPLGSTEAASFSLEISNVGRKYTPEKFDNAEVHMFIGIKNGSDYVYSDFGVWHVEDSSAPEQSVSISISGYDALASRFAAVFTDAEDVYPTTIGDIALTVCKAANIPLKDISFPNAAVEVEEMPKWTEGTTLRDILSYCAICAGGFARIALNGQLEIVSFADGATYTVDPDLYQTFTPSGGSAFNFNRIEAFLSEDAEERVPFFINEDIEPNATNALQIDYNPLLTEAIVQSIVTELTGITMSAAELTWGGDPTVKCSDYFIVETLNGVSTKMMVTAQSVSFEGGLSVTETCSLPTINTITSATYSTSTNMYDAQGNIRATRISGLDKKVITATTGHFENLTVESAEVDTLLVSLLNAVNLISNMIDAKVIKAGSITAELLAADVISAELVKTGALEAVTAKIEKLTASDIYTDRLAAALAAFTVVTAGTAEFDRATIEHLVANLFNLTGSGVMDDVFIHNLRVAYAQIVSAAIGNLVIKASDGNYYEIDVDASGNVSAALSTVTDGEISAGQTDAGKVILGTDITAESLNTSNLLATYALVNKIDAARIDVDQLWAREAFIAHLNTTDISGNGTIRVMAKSIEDASTKADNAATKADDAATKADAASEKADASYESASTAQSTAENAGAMASAAVESIGDIPNYMEIKPDGVYIKDQEGASTLKLNSASVSIGTVAGGAADGYSQFTASYAQFGNYQIRKSADGGLVFKLKG